VEVWAYQTIENYVYPDAASGIGAWAAKLEAGPDALVEFFEPADVQAIVVGGETKPYWSIAGARTRPGSTVSIDAWR
jgi:hypothetical protein